MKTKGLESTSNHTLNVNDSELKSREALLDNGLDFNRRALSRKRRTGIVAGLALAASTLPMAEGQSTEKPRSAPIYESATPWAGYVAATSAGLNFIKGDWIVPTLSCPPSGNYDASAWVGLGQGTQSDQLYQTGIGMACSDGVASYRVWWEQYPTNAEQDYPPTHNVSAGDKLVAVVSLNQYGPLLEVQDYGPDLSNYAPNWTLWHQINGVPAVTPSTAECIVEQPLDGGARSNLTNFGSLFFSDEASTSFNQGCDMAANDNDHIISSNNPRAIVNKYNILNTNDDILASTTDAVSTGGYSVEWQASN